MKKVFSYFSRTSLLLIFIFQALSSFARQSDSNAQNALFTMHFESTDQNIAPLISRTLSQRAKTIEHFFGKPFAKKFEVRILANRAALNTYWSEAWNIPGLKTECWMVASGTAKELTILSPNAWSEDACEHTIADTLKTQLLLAHELTHVYHGQYNPQPEFEGLDAIGWFVEGLAVLVSGQLDAGHLAAAKEAIEHGKAPTQLANAWSGKYRYGVSGSLVQHIENRYGREKLISLLSSTSEKEILDELQLTEQELLTQWQKAVIEQQKSLSH